MAWLVSVSVSALALILVLVSALVLVSGWDFVPMFVPGPMSASYVLTFKVNGMSGDIWC